MRRPILAVLLTLATVGMPAPSPGAGPGPLAFEQRWAADPTTEGLDAFVGIEDDRSDSHPGVTHIFAEPGQYRFVMHRADRDGSDRQRQEVRAIKENGQRVDMHLGETWRYTYQMFIPASLKATTSFTHIFQVKHTAVASPVVTMSLNRSGSSERVEMRLFGEGQAKLGVTDLAPLRDKWVDVEIEIKVADGSGGSLRYALRSGGTTYVDASRSGVDTWLGGDQAHPKWGIYRSISDSGQIADTYLLLRNMRAFELVPGGEPPASAYEAEASGNTRNGAAASAACANCSGAQKVRFVGGATANWLRFNGVAGGSTGGSRQLTVYGTVSGTRTVSVSVNNGAAQQLSLTGSTWDTPVSATLTVPLNAGGGNTIRFFNDTANAPDLDRITIG